MPSASPTPQFPAAGGSRLSRPAGLEQVAAGRFAPATFLAPMSHPFFTACLGKWSVDVTGQLAGWGHASYRMAAGGRVLVEEHDWVCATAPGLKYHALSVWRASPDGTSLAGWAFDNADPEPIHFCGTLSSTVADVTGDCNDGRRRRVMTVTEDGIDVRLYIGEVELLRSIRRRID